MLLFKNAQKGENSKIQSKPCSLELKKNDLK